MRPAVLFEVDLFARLPRTLPFPVQRLLALSGTTPGLECSSVDGNPGRASRRSLSARFGLAHPFSKDPASRLRTRATGTSLFLPESASGPRVPQSLPDERQTHRFPPDVQSGRIARALNSRARVPPTLSQQVRKCGGGLGN